jgi:hypothetical protein
MAYEAVSLFVIFLIFRIITGIAVFMAWRKTKKQNLLLLFLFFVINSITLLILIFENVLLYDISTIISIFVILVFIDRTFYQDRKSPLKLLLILTLVLGAFAIVFINIFNSSLLLPRIISFGIHNWLVGALFIMFGIWSFIAASNSLKSIGSSEAVEPWVKGRYRLVLFYSVGIILVGAFTPFTPMEGTINWALLAVLVSNILRISGETLAWVMPKWLKIFFNRGYTATDIKEDLTEEEIMEGMK